MMRNIGLKTDQNPAWQSPNPVVLCVISKDLSGSVLPDLLILTHFIYRLVPCTIYSSSWQISLSSGTLEVPSWGLHHNPYSTFTDLCKRASQGLYKETPLPSKCSKQLS